MMNVCESVILDFVISFSGHTQTNFTNIGTKGPMLAKCATRAYFNPAQNMILDLVGHHFSTSLTSRKLFLDKMPLEVSTHIQYNLNIHKIIDI